MIFLWVAGREEFINAQQKYTLRQPAIYNIAKSELNSLLNFPQTKIILVMTI